jgi:hypothetical protein
LFSSSSPSFQRSHHSVPQDAPSSAHHIFIPYWYALVKVEFLSNFRDWKLIKNLKCFFFSQKIELYCQGVSVQHLGQQHKTKELTSGGERWLKDLVVEGDQMQVMVLIWVLARPVPQVEFLFRVWRPSPYIYINYWRNFAKKRKLKKKG